MAYSLMFFPLVGCITGGLVLLLNFILPVAELPVLVRIPLTVAIPLFITGGIHIDGFMDVEDALHSYADAKKKLEILKDPHIGAFAVISLVKWMLLYVAGAAAVLLYPGADIKMLLPAALIFVIARCFSGLTSLYFKKAKDDGMLYNETKDRKGAVAAFLLVWLAAALTAGLFTEPAGTVLILLTFIFWTVFYRRMAYKQFGGVTGDTAGYYLTVGEILSLLVLAAGMYAR